ncbi:plasmid mobilization relaxosome protein MobC [Mucilaginibacter sp. L3T2-6]|uniref:plasmid mobilization protein n=1 Tax=Mucilaginibacter sp. L3T2-6 TaxID=3062491 RepID=UPI002676047C|nr:plasmid mobilization relaxosome protein MobC [Mucilaginibacter sp. L3T2-6]MDO3645296.1 plasmid mobilization relaxosome protein MobC [Mucilaginibacter sp. L3T2-6]MDV6217803.1 plasmid mobilization relaxosome protein MobC [Mucilaginibacter sp. L3T2-6]
METTLMTGTKIPKPKHKGGRPKASIKRESHAKIRLTATERILYNGRAKDAGMSLSDFVRDAIKSARVIARLSVEDMKLMRMMTGLANNLNQLTKLAHRDGLLSVARKCSEVLNDIDQALKYFNNDDR